MPTTNTKGYCCLLTVAVWFFSLILGFWPQSSDKVDPIAIIQQWKPVSTSTARPRWSKPEDPKVTDSSWRDSPHLQSELAELRASRPADKGDGSLSDHTYSHTIHLVPHSHMDFGWLKPYEEYFKSDVIKILDTVVDALWMSPSLRFVLADIAFVHMWWEQTTTLRRMQLRELILQGQIELLSGSLTMNDEACNMFEHILGNFREGRRVIRDVFGLGSAPIDTAWFIDPFGHSLTMMRTTLDLGMRNMFIMRVDDETKRSRTNSSTLNFRWRDSRTNQTLNIFILLKGYAMDSSLELYYKRYTQFIMQC